MTFVPSKAVTGSLTTISIGGVTGTTGTETFTLVGEVTDIKFSGSKRATTTYYPLGNGGVANKLDTTLDYGTVTVTCSLISNDAGQVAVTNAHQTGGKWDFKIQSPVNSKLGQTTTGDLRALSAIVTEVGGFDANAGKEQEFTFTLDIDGPVTFTVGS